MSITLNQLAILFLTTMAFIFTVWESRNKRFNLRIDKLEDGQSQTLSSCSKTEQHLKAVNGRIGDIEDWRHRFTETPPWKEVLVEQGRILGKMDDVARIIRELEHRYPEARRD